MCTAIIPPLYPPTPFVFISSTTDCKPASIDLEHIITRAPIEHKALQVSRPIPEFPPVTKKVLPFK